MSNDDINDREKILIKAKCADYANEFDEMFKLMKELASKGEELSDRESDYFGSSVRNFRHDKKDALKRLKRLGEKEENSTKKQVIQEYIKKINKQLVEFYEDVLKTLDDYILPNCSSDESHVFFLKLKGDVYRYMLEVQTTPEYESSGKEVYEKALEKAEKLDNINPVKLGLICNYTYFLFDFLSKRAEAVELAKKTIEKANEKKDDLEEKNYKDSKNTLEFLKENLEVWEKEMKE